MIEILVFECFQNERDVHDFRKNQRCPKPVYIKGEAVERVDTYIGVVFDSKLNWKENINSVLKKVNSRMYYMRKLRSFGVNSDMLVTFYNAVICSIIMFGSVCWGGSTSKLDTGRLEKIVKKKASHVVGTPLDSFLPTDLSVFNENYTSH